jgi:hypothetical protein
MSKLVEAAKATPQPVDYTLDVASEDVGDQTLLWDAPSSPSYSTRLGFVFESDASPRAAEEKGYQANRLFVPGLVHHSPLLSFLSNTSTVSDTSRNIISFIYRHDPPLAAPGTSPKARKQLVFGKAKGFLPEIRFDFALAAHKGKSPTLDGIHATIKDNSYSVALPDKPIDFNVAERCAPKVHIQKEETKQFFATIVEEMIASIKGEARLRAQSTLEVPIPCSWTSPSHGKQFGLWGADPFKASHLKTRYRFIGVEHRQTVTFEREGRAYEFTTVEGGKLGARYSELSVLGDKAGVAEEQRDQSLTKAFDVGFEMVDLVDRASRGLLTFGDAKGGDLVAEESGEVIVEEMGHAVAVEDKSYEIEEHVLEHEEVQRAAASG